MGLAIGAYGMTQALLQIPSVLSDRLGRKPVIAAGLLCSPGQRGGGLSSSIHGVILGRALQGRAPSPRRDGRQPTSPRGQRTKVLAIIGMSIGLSFWSPC